MPCSIAAALTHDHFFRPLLALVVQLDFKCNPLADLRPATTRQGERLDVADDGLPVLHGLNETKAPILLPRLDGAREWHGRVNILLTGEMPQAARPVEMMIAFNDGKWAGNIVFASSICHIIR